MAGLKSPEELAHAWREALVGGDADAFGALFPEDALFVDVEHRTADSEGPVELDGVSWLRCASGEIVGARVYFDSLGLYRGLDRV